MGSLILCLNRGSSSLKFGLYQQEKLYLEGALEYDEKLFWTRGAIERRSDCKEEGVQPLFTFLQECNLPLAAIGHRVVHGGAQLTEPTLITPQVLQDLKALIPLAPLHLPPEIETIEASAQAFPNLPQIACFDTAFFHNLPEASKRFALPEHFSEIYRYGFHGLSYEYITAQGIAPKTIIAHLGSGASLAAIENGKPIDTTMGFSPTGGILMGTRLGDIDPGVLIYLMREKGMNADQIERLVNKESGLLALSNQSADMHTLLENKSEFAIEMFCRDVAKTIAAFTTELCGLDQLIFTAGIGERADAVRKQICEKLLPLGAKLDPAQNQTHARTISSSDSAFAISVIPTNENAMIASHVHISLQKCV